MQSNSNFRYIVDLFIYKSGLNLDLNAGKSQSLKSIKQMIFKKNFENKGENKK